MDDSLDKKALMMARRPVGRLQKMSRTVQMLRHYDSIQILRRVRNVLAGKLQPRKRIGHIQSDLGRLKGSGKISALADCIIEMNADHPSHGQCDITAGRYVMLNEPISMPIFQEGFDSEALNQQSHLWRFQFHYHEFLLTQAAHGNGHGVNEFLEAWLAEYSPEKVKRKDDAWHPYCISRRLVAWVWLLNAAPSNTVAIESQLAGRMVDSSIQQANYLSQNLERDLGGNHLLENATALAITGGTIDSKHAKHWRDLAAQVLAVELPKQILTHGEHFELSPMYHCQILSNLLRIELCCPGDQALLDLVSPVIDPMLNFLGSIIHPDEEIPLLADSGFHEAPSVEEISIVAGLTGRTLNLMPLEDALTSVGGYRVYRGEKLFAVCDYGPIAAAKLPAHGHCDVTNLELSVEGVRWIVDSGNFNYADDSMRHYCRSSIGHKVVTVNDENQANIWSKFRMGNRPETFGHQKGERDGFHWATASHNGYRRLGVPIVSRLVAFRGHTAMCFDRGQNAGGNERSLAGYLHFHPDVSVTRETDQADGIVRFRLAHQSTERRISFVADEVSTEQGWYCSGFGERAPSTVVRYVRAKTDQVFGWMLHEMGDQPLIKYSANSIQIIMNGLDVSWTEFPNEN